MPISHNDLASASELEPLLFETGINLVDMLVSRSRALSDRVAFRFLEENVGANTVTYRELDEAARCIASGLLQRFQPGEPAALVFPPGLDFVKAFLGCVYAGILPVPATYPKPRRPSTRLSSIVADAQPVAILTTQRVMETIANSKMADGLPKQNWLSCEELASCRCDAWQPPKISGDEIAFLQYTSGSTKDPRGVAVSHDNISINLEMIREGFGLSQAMPRVGVSWLPAYHDMGLIGGILESLYVGGTTILMSPMSFLQKPLRWLQAISDYQAVISGGPNFAYELCLRKIKPADISDLDLSSWRVAFSGAEPIRATTLRRFAEMLSPCGFSDSSFYPCYGMAEATLLVSGASGPGTITTRQIEASALQRQGRAVECDAAFEEASLELVGCGSPLMDEEVVIVDPDTRVACEEGAVGEIWIRGRNVAQGYYGRDVETEETFHAKLADGGDKRFLRSGDLGFLNDGILFVTGRRKELLIIRGRNHYPHDLESTVQESHRHLIPGGGAALLVDGRGDDLLVLVQEVDRASNPSEREAILAEIRRNVALEHDVFVHEVILIRMGSLPRTTSGKVRYADVRQQYLEGELAVIDRWSFANRSTPEASTVDQSQSQSDSLQRLLELPEIRDRESLAREIQSRLMTWLSEVTDVAQADLDSARPLAESGLDSLAAMELMGHLEAGLGLQLSPTVAWTYPTPELLAGHLAERMLPIEDSRTEFDSESVETREEFDEPQDDEFDKLLAQLEEMPDEEVAEFLTFEERSEASE